MVYLLSKVGKGYLIVMGKEDLAVYESLRNEIISAQSTRTNLIVYMYTVYAVLFGWGVERSRVFFVITFLILLPFQGKINRCKYTIARISSYIKVFFEEDPRHNIHWEEAYDNVQKEAKYPNGRGPLRLLSISGSIPLGILSISAYLLSFRLERENTVSCICECEAKAECIKKILFECGCETCKKISCNCTPHKIPLFADIIMILLSAVCLLILFLSPHDYKANPKDIKEFDRLHKCVRGKNYPNTVFKNPDNDIIPKTQIYWAEYVVREGESIQDYATECFIIINSILADTNTVQIECCNPNIENPINLSKGLPVDLFQNRKVILTLKEVDEGVCTIIIWHN